MLRNVAKSHIVSFVNKNGPCNTKDLEQCKELVPYLHLSYPYNYSILELLDELVQAGEVVQIEYVTLARPGIYQRMLFPKGSRIVLYHQSMGSTSSELEY